MCNSFFLFNCITYEEEKEFESHIIMRRNKNPNSTKEKEVGSPLKTCSLSTKLFYFQVKRMINIQANLIYRLNFGPIRYLYRIKPNVPTSTACKNEYETLANSPLNLLQCNNILLTFLHN